jgi:alkylation response protein AidB-like acyl-CoA dehydrogenase
MDFRLSEESLMLGETAQRMMLETCTNAHLRSLAASGEGRDAERWGQIAAMGLPGMLADVELGGGGLDAVSALLVAEACGRVALPEPLIEHAGVAVPLLAATGAAPDLLEAAIAGEALLAVGHPINPLVAHADGAKALLLAHADEVHLVPAASATLTRRESLDEFRRLFEVAWTPTAATRIADAETGRRLWAEALQRGALLTAGEALGLATGAIELAVDYAKVREQFGKPIGVNQAVKHMLADQQVKLSFARPVVLAAAADFEADDLVSAARVSHAKLAATAAADSAARTAVQVFGAMGMTAEAGVHFYIKRALALLNAWGAPAFHRDRIADRVLAGGPIGPEHAFIRYGAAA